MKNELDIKTDIFLYLKESELIANISGKLSKTLRPANSNLEDVVISVLTPPTGNQVNEVYVNVNIYVSDLLRATQYEENTIRLQELCKLAYKALKSAFINGSHISLSEQKVMEVQGKNEHFINNKVLYQHCKE